jgi:hypothetical protein
MTQEHLIRPPHELVQQWVSLACENEGYETWQDLATQAARWGYQQRVRSSPECPLVERVADAIAAEATSAGIVNDRPARAAILQVAMWLREQHDGDLVAATVLEREVAA